MTAEDDREALRRRYGPDSATDPPEARAVVAAPQTPPPHLPPSPDPSRGRHRIVALVAGLVLVLVAVLGLVRLGAERAPAAVAPTPVATDAATREDLEASLASGRDAGIAAYLVTNRTLPQLDGVTRLVTTEGRGTGTGTLRVPAIGGTSRATVLLVLGSDGDPRWTLESRGDAVLGTRGGEQDAGVLTAATLSFPAGRAPVVLRVEAPRGVRWGAAVVLTD